MGCCFFKKEKNEIHSSEERAKDPKVGKANSVPEDKDDIKIDT